MNGETLVPTPPLITKMERMRDRRKKEAEKPSTPPTNIANEPKLKDLLPSPPSSAGGLTNHHRNRSANTTNNTLLVSPDVDDVTLPFEPFQVNNDITYDLNSPTVMFPDTPQLFSSTRKNSLVKVDKVYQKSDNCFGRSKQSRQNVFVNTKSKITRRSPNDTPLPCDSKYLPGFLPLSVDNNSNLVDESPPLTPTPTVIAASRRVSTRQLVPLVDTVGPVVVDQIRNEARSVKGMNSTTFCQFPDTPISERTVYSEGNSEINV